jgi:hypothetical protein
MIVMIATGKGENQEDSIILNEASVGRGKFFQLVYITLELQETGGQSGQIRIVPLDVESLPLEMRKQMHALGDDGIARLNTEVKEDDVLVSALQYDITNTSSTTYADLHSKIVGLLTRRRVAVETEVFNQYNLAFHQLWNSVHALLSTSQENVIGIRRFLETQPLTPMFEQYLRLRTPESKTREVRTPENVLREILERWPNSSVVIYIIKLLIESRDASLPIDVNVPLRELLRFRGVSEVPLLVQRANFLAWERRANIPRDEGDGIMNANNILNIVNQLLLDYNLDTPDTKQATDIVNNTIPVSPELAQLDRQIAERRSELKRVKGTPHFHHLRVGVGEYGTVDRVMVLGGKEPRLVKVSLRKERRLREGDKMSSEYAQKTTISLLRPDYRMPFILRTGQRVDAIFNPHSVISRMTMGKLLEVLRGKGDAMFGTRFDVNGFRKYDEQHLLQNLQAIGCNIQGPEEMVNPDTGELLTALIVTGPIAYQALKHQVDDKLQSRDGDGDYDPVTHRPVKGRDRGGGMSFAEMERNSVLAHGAASFVQDRLSGQASVTDIVLCVKCCQVAKTSLQQTYECINCNLNGAGVSQFATTKIPISWISSSKILGAAGVRTQIRFEAPIDPTGMLSTKASSNDVIKLDSQTLQARYVDITSEEGRWRTYLTVNGKRTALGAFATEKDAVDFLIRRFGGVDPNSRWDLYVTVNRERTHVGAFTNQSNQAILAELTKRQQPRG